jgi:hypothetical protein
MNMGQGYHKGFASSRPLHNILALQMDFGPPRIVTTLFYTICFFQNPEIALKPDPKS